MTPEYMMTLPPNSLAVRDWEQKKERMDLAEFAEHCAETSGRPLRQMLKESQKGQTWAGQMTGREYLEQRLYLLGRDERKQFISEALLWVIHDICNDPEWVDRAEEKWTCTKILEDAGVTTIPILAMVDSTGANYDGAATISTGEEMAAFLSTASFPLFAKPNKLLSSMGVFRIESFNGDHAVTHLGESVTPSDLIVELMANIPYLLQNVEENHPEIQKFATGLATIRVVNFVSGGDVRLDRAILKIPGSGEIADNNWRQGSILAHIDTASGEILRASSGKGGHYVEFDVHPTTGAPLVGTVLPHWDDVRALNERSASLFTPLPMQSADVAITANGPMIVEVNSGGSFSLPQLASGYGMLTPENKAFYESFGVNFSGLAADPAAAA